MAIPRHVAGGASREGNGNPAGSTSHALNNTSPSSSNNEVRSSEDLSAYDEEDLDALLGLDEDPFAEENNASDDGNESVSNSAQLDADGQDSNDEDDLPGLNVTSHTSVSSRGPSIVPVRPTEAISATSPTPNLPDSEKPSESRTARSTGTTASPSPNDDPMLRSILFDDEDDFLYGEGGKENFGWKPKNSTQNNVPTSARSNSTSRTALPSSVDAEDSEDDDDELPSIDRTFTSHRNASHSGGTPVAPVSGGSRIPNSPGASSPTPPATYVDENATHTEENMSEDDDILPGITPVREVNDSTPASQVSNNNAPQANTESDPDMDTLLDDDFFTALMNGTESTDVDSADNVDNLPGDSESTLPSNAFDEEDEDISELLRAMEISDAEIEASLPEEDEEIVLTKDDDSEDAENELSDEEIAAVMNSVDIPVDNFSEDEEFQSLLRDLDVDLDMDSPSSSTDSEVDYSEDDDAFFRAIEEVEDEYDETTSDDDMDDVDLDSIVRNLMEESENTDTTTVLEEDSEDDSISSALFYDDDLDDEDSDPLRQVREGMRDMRDASIVRPGSAPLDLDYSALSSGSSAASDDDMDIDLGDLDDIDLSDIEADDDSDDNNALSYEDEEEFDASEYSAFPARRKKGQEDEESEPSYGERTSSRGSTLDDSEGEEGTEDENDEPRFNFFNKLKKGKNSTSKDDDSSEDEESRSKAVKNKKPSKKKDSSARSEKFASIWAEIKSDFHGGDDSYDPNAKKRARARDEEDEDEGLDDEEDTPKRGGGKKRRGSRKVSGKGIQLPGFLKKIFSPFVKIYMLIASIFFKIVGGIVKILTSLPLIGKLFVPLQKVLPLLERIATFVPLLLFIAAVIVASLFKVPGTVQQTELIDNGASTLTSFNSEGNVVSGEVKNDGDLILDGAVTFEVYSWNFTASPSTWVSPQKVAECTSAPFSVDIDSVSQVSADCGEIPGFFPRVTGKVVQ